MKSTMVCLAMIAVVLASNESAEAASCKKYKSCAEAVKAWCAGTHPSADRDGDGIPCENVCKSLRQVKAIIKSSKITCPK